MTPEVSFVVSILVWPVLAYVTEFLKRQFGVSQNSSMLIVAVICGALYTAYSLLIPEASKEQILSFVLAAAWTSHLVYQIVIKKKR